MQCTTTRQNKYFKTDKITWIDWLILGILVIVSIVSAVFTFDGFFSLLSIFATMTYTVSVWQKNSTVYKVLGIFASLLWIAYGIYIMSIFSIILETALLVAELIGTIKAYKEKQKIKIEAQEM